jgi:hypothetical protein
LSEGRGIKANATSVICLAAAACLAAPLQVFGRGTDFCKIAPVESCRRLIARPDRSAKESAHPGTSGKTLERRVHISAGVALLSWHEKRRRRQIGSRTLAGCANVWCMFDPAWPTRASKEKRQSSTPLGLPWAASLVEPAWPRSSRAASTDGWPRRKFRGARPSCRR